MTNNLPAGRPGAVRAAGSERRYGSRGSPGAGEGLRLAVVLLIGCRGEPARAPDLASYLTEVAALDDAAYARTAASWQLDRATWDRIVVAPFTALYDDSFTPPARFRGPIATRKHYAGDPELTLAQARSRWLLPTLFPSEVATAGGVPIDAVFLRDGERWFALTGTDRAIRTRVDRHDPACGVAIDTPAASKTCRDAAWAVADATLRNDITRIQRACAIAKTVCGKPSP